MVSNGELIAEHGAGGNFTGPRDFVRTTPSARLLDMKRFLLLLALISSASLACGRWPASEPSRPADQTEHSHGEDEKMEHGRKTHAEMKSSPGAASAPLELQFLDTMSVHHQGAVDMATLAEGRAQHPELKELAAGIIYDQEREIARMSGLRDRWFGEHAPAINMEFPGMSHGMHGMDVDKLRGLSGNAFDIEFLKQMIPHHEGAIEMSRAVAGADSYAELKELAGDIITAQQDEIRRMRQWLADWSK